MRTPPVVALAAALLAPIAADAADARPLPPPVTPACISSPYGPRVMPNRPLAGVFHNGIDLPAPVGAPVKAVAPGILIRVQRRGVGGLEVLVQHDGFIGVYSHLGLVAPQIAEGQRAIRTGERIGTVGRSGLTYGPHLYFGMIADGRSVDPAPYLQVAPCNGRPWDARIHPTRAYAGG